MTPPKGKKPEDELEWFTVSYRTIYAAIGTVVLLVALGAYYYKVQQDRQPVQPPDTTPAMSTARFTAIAGAVKYKKFSTFEWLAADRTAALRRGDMVQTGSSSTAEITFIDSTIIHVRPDSLIVIEESTQDPNTKAVRLKTTITSGEVNFTTAKQSVPGSQTEFSTKTFKANAGADTQGSVSTAESGQGELRIFRGTGTVRTNTGESIAVGQNTAVPINAEGKAGPAIKLPDFPLLQAPPHLAEISYPDPAHATTLLSWKAVPGAALYHVQLDTGAVFAKPFVDQRDLKQSQVEVRGLDIGKYYWHVSAIDKDNHEGAFSDFARFTVTKPAATEDGGATPAPAKLVIDALDVNGNILNAKGHSEPGATVTLNGQRVDVQPDGTFNEYIQLDAAGKQIIVIRAVSINGGSTEQRRTVVVGY